MGILVNNRPAIVILLLLIVGLFFWWGDDEFVEAPTDSAEMPDSKRAKTPAGAAYQPNERTTWPQQGSPYGGFRQLPGNSPSTYEPLNSIPPSWKQPYRGASEPFPYQPQGSVTGSRNPQLEYRQPAYGNPQYPASPRYQFRPQEQRGTSKKRYTGNYVPPR